MRHHILGVLLLVVTAIVSYDVWRRFNADPGPGNLDGWACPAGLGEVEEISPSGGRTIYCVQTVQQSVGGIALPFHVKDGPFLVRTSTGARDALGACRSGHATVEWVNLESAKKSNPEWNASNVHLIGEALEAFMNAQGSCSH